MMLNNFLDYRPFKDESELPALMRLIEKDLSEPYSIYTYRYFISNWPGLCHLVYDRRNSDGLNHDDDDNGGGRLVGVIIGKMAMHRCSQRMRGYIAMLAVHKDYRKAGIGTTLVQVLLKAMLEEGAEEIVLEAEESNHAALRMYAKLGFVRAKRLPRYYLNGSDAFRLKLWTVTHLNDLND